MESVVFEIQGKKLSSPPSNNQENIMNAVRKIYENLPPTIKTPVSLKNRRVEVILLPLDGDADSGRSKALKKAYPIDDFIGAWKGERLVRPDQGDFEVREPLK